MKNLVKRSPRYFDLPVPLTPEAGETSCGPNEKNSSNDHLLSCDSIALPSASSLISKTNGDQMMRIDNSINRNRSKISRYFDQTESNDIKDTDHDAKGDEVEQDEKDDDWLRSQPINATAVRTRFHKERIQRRNDEILTFKGIFNDSKILNIQDQGFVRASSVDKNPEKLSTISQSDILRNANLLTASKRFDLMLDKFGPYIVDYTRNGRHLLLAGHKGHLTSFDWQTKQLHFEINVMEKIMAAKWLHNEMFMAVAQKRWTYVYDKQGVEIHCLKALDRVNHITFLPYHFILVALNMNNYLSFLDVSTGKIITGFNARANAGKADVLCENSSNGISITGHASGCVNFWSPNVREPLVTMLTHGCQIHDVQVNYSGTTLATLGIDRKLKIWDLRMYKLLSSHKLTGSANRLCFSQTDQIAVSFKRDVKVFNHFDTMDSPANTLKEYMQYTETGSIASMRFCPFEDVLGIGHDKGFSSILIPGSGEANFDAYEINPYQTKRQRQDAEVRALIEKIPHELITLNNSALYEIDVKTAVCSENDIKKSKVPKISAKKDKKLKKAKLSKRLVSLRKMREMAVRSVVRNQSAKENKVKVKPKTRKDAMIEDPLFGRFKNTVSSL